MPKKKFCIHCDEEIKYRYTTIQNTCSINCQLEYNREHPEKVKSYVQHLEDKEWQKQKKIIKEKIKTLSEHEADARKQFQVWIRRRDKDLPCVSCGSSTSQIWHAGHFLKAELYSGMIFMPENVHKQCSKCNVYLGGNELNYRIGLVNRYGEDYVLRLEAIKDKLRNYKYTREEYLRIKNTYIGKLKNG